MEHLPYRRDTSLAKLSKEWEKKLAYFELSGSKLYLRRQTPFKIRLQRAVDRLEAQGRAVDGAIDRLAERDRQLFSKLTNSYSAHDARMANVYASELAEVRKTARLMMNIRLSLEKTTLRLSRIHQLGSIANVLVPSIKDLQSIRNGVGSILPNADLEIGLISDILEQIVTESEQPSGMDLSPEMANEDAKEILKEALIVAEQKTEDEAPETPILQRFADKSVDEHMKA